MMQIEGSVSKRSELVQSLLRQRQLKNRNLLMKINKTIQ